MKTYFSSRGRSKDSFWQYPPQDLSFLVVHSSQTAPPQTVPTVLYLQDDIEATEDDDTSLSKISPHSAGTQFGVGSIILPNNRIQGLLDRLETLINGSVTLGLE